MRYANMQINDIENLCNNAMKTGYSKAIADALKEVINVLRNICKLWYTWILKKKKKNSSFGS